MDYQQLAADAARMASFSADVQRNLAAAAGVSTDNVGILNVTAGSVVVTSRIAMASQAAAEALVSRATSAPSSLFDPSFTSNYGPVQQVQGAPR